MNFQRTGNLCWFSPQTSLGTSPQGYIQAMSL